MPRCRECSEEFASSQPAAAFCSPPCRVAFNNRRASRGAVLYDLFMALRYQRGVAKAKGLWSLMCALGQKYREEDAKRGQGWISWLDPDAALKDKPWLRSIVTRS